jgi:hypothetical protein
MTPTYPVQSGSSATPEGKEPATPQSSDAPREETPKPKAEVGARRTVRKSRKIWQPEPNGIDHAILLVGLGFVVLVMVYVIFRAIEASHR